MVAGAERTYRRYIPPAAGDGPLPVVVNLHGLLSNIGQQVSISGFEDLAASERFIVLTPQALGTPASWDMKLGAANADVAFIGQMLDEAEGAACVDAARVYASGLSDGGIMSSVLACAMPARIAAIGVVSGIVRPDGCAPSRAIPVIAFWGKKDVVLPYCGGLGPIVSNLVQGKVQATPAAPSCPPASYQGFPPVEQVVGAWAHGDGCAASPELTQAADDVELRAYTGCRDGSAVRLYSVIDGGHTWPGSAFMEAVSRAGVAIIGHTTDSIDATMLIWRFFQGYALPS
jgi:polyhydroxybutyrate depolymerase